MYDSLVVTLHLLLLSTECLSSEFEPMSCLGTIVWNAVAFPSGSGQKWTADLRQAVVEPSRAVGENADILQVQLLLIEKLHKVSLTHNISFWAQKLTHNVSFWAQKLFWPIITISGPRNWHIMSVSGPKNRDYGSASFLGPETDVMGQFMDPETGTFFSVLGRKSFLNNSGH